MEKVLQVWVKGSCAGPGRGPGGWAVGLVWGGRTKILHGGMEEETTANRMELLAAVKAFEEIKRPVSVDLVTNSTYIENGFRRVMNEKLIPSSNDDLWARLNELARKMPVACRWVRSSDHTVNAQVITAAAQEARAAGAKILAESRAALLPGDLFSLSGG